MKNRAEGNMQAAVVAGVGDRNGIGGAICARLAAEGFTVYAVGRNKEKLEGLAGELKSDGGTLVPTLADTTQPDEVAGLFDRMQKDGCSPEIVVFNASELNMPKPLLDMTPEYVENMWRVCCMGGFLVGQEAIRRMLPQNHGTLLFTGATASLRGSAGFSAFAAAKAGLRSHAQSMAREFGPQGIHVAHVIIDGGVDGARLQAFKQGQEFVKSKGENGALDPEAIAESYWQIHCQSASAWTHELDLRPFKEPF